MSKRLPLTVLSAMLFSTAAFAHPGHGAHVENGFLAGFLHPLTGLDHILAMVAVGLWAAALGGRAVLAVPAAVVTFMSAGVLAALGGVPLPYVEPMILGSVVVIGLLVAASVRLPVVPAAILIGLFAVFHGHAHGTEMGQSETLVYGAGFLIATVLLHGAGIWLAVALTRFDLRDLPVRALGAATAFTGLLVFVAG